MFCETSLPRSLVTKNSFTTLLYDLGINKISRAELDNAIKKTSENILHTVYLNLSKSKCNTICVDEWTNVCSNSIVNFTVINDKGEAFLVDVVDNSLSRNTTVRIAYLTHQVISKLRKFKVKITGLITDNCNAMRGLKDQMHASFPNCGYKSLIQVGCCCHILAIVMKRISSIPYINNAMTIVNNVINCSYIDVQYY